MKMPICPTCRGGKLIKSKAITSIHHPNAGKEYLICPRCASKWFMDDPNRPVALPPKSKQSIWKTLSTWGCPHNEPDVFGAIHPATYIFPRRHDYPPYFLPNANTSGQPVQSPPSNPESKPPDQPKLPPPAAESSQQPASPIPEPAQQPASPAPQPDEHPASPAPESDQPVLLSNVSPHDPQVDLLPPEEQIISFEQQDPTEDEPHEAQEMSQDVNQISSEPPQEEHASKPGSVLDVNREKQALLERLSTIINSPLPPFLNSQRGDTHELTDLRTVLRDDSQPSEAGKIGFELFSPDEKQRLQQLLVNATPAPPSPRGYYSHTSSPKPALQELTHSEKYREELDNADHARRRAERINHAIQNSPFLSLSRLQSPRSEKLINSPRFSQPKSPVSMHSDSRSSRHLLASSISPISRSPKQFDRDIQSMPHSPYVDDLLTLPKPLDQDAQSMSRSPYVDDPVPLPGAFPTPKPAPLTHEALSRLSKQSSRHSESVRSKTVSTSLPVPPSHNRSTSVTRTLPRGSLKSAGKSPLFS